MINPCFPHLKLNTMKHFVLSFYVIKRKKRPQTKFKLMKRVQRFVKHLMVLILFDENKGKQAEMGKHHKTNQFILTRLQKSFIIELKIFVEVFDQN